MPEQTQGRTNAKLLKTLIGIVTSLGAWNLQQTYSMNARLERMDQKLDDKNMENQIKLLWRYTAWLDNEVNSVRYGRPPATRPGFDLHE